MLRRPCGFGQRLRQRNQVQGGVDIRLEALQAAIGEWPGVGDAASRLGKAGVVQHFRLLLGRRAKRYFKEQRVPFKEVNLERDPEAARDVVRKTGQTGVPGIKIGNRWIVGFDKGRIEKELALQSMLRLISRPKVFSRRSSSIRPS
jgi:glutaredoxin 3